MNRADQICKDDCLGGVLEGSLLIEIKKSILNRIDIVHGCIQNYVTDLKGAIIKNCSVYQMYHMIVCVFNQLYELDLKKKILRKRDKKECDKWLKSFKKYAKKWYLLHRINSFWNEHRQVSDLRKLLDEKDSKLYVTNISRECWEENLRKFFDKNKSDADSRNISNESKLLLNCLYRMLIQEDKNRMDYFASKDSHGNEIIFDIEHIAPVDKFKHFDEDLPMSAIGNLCYLPVKDNRSKRDKTIYEYAGDRPSLTFKPEFLDLIMYPSREQLEFLDCDFESFKKSYLAMLDERENKILDQFIGLIMKY